MAVKTKKPYTQIGRWYTSQTGIRCIAVRPLVRFTEREWRWVESLARKKSKPVGEVAQSIIHAGLANTEFWDEDDRLAPDMGE